MSLSGSACQTAHRVRVDKRVGAGSTGTVVRSREGGKARGLEHTQPVNSQYICT